MKYQQTWLWVWVGWALRASLAPRPFYVLIVRLCLPYSASSPVSLTVPWSHIKVHLSDELWIQLKPHTRKVCVRLFMLLYGASQKQGRYLKSLHYTAPFNGCHQCRATFGRVPDSLASVDRSPVCGPLSDIAPLRLANTITLSKCRELSV
jgi:hypothetical protein